MLIPRLKKPRERSRYWLFPLERNQGASGTRTTRRHKRTLTESRCWYTIGNRGEKCSRDSMHRYRFSMKRKPETHRGISSIKFAMTNMGIEFIASHSSPFIPPPIPSFLLFLLFLRLVRTAKTFHGNIAINYRRFSEAKSFFPGKEPRRRRRRRRSFKPRVISMYHGRELF